MDRRGHRQAVSAAAVRVAAEARAVEEPMQREIADRQRKQDEIYLRSLRGGHGRRKPEPGSRHN